MTDTIQRAKDLRSQNFTHKQIGLMLGVSASTISRYLKTEEATEAFKDLKARTKADKEKILDVYNLGQYFTANDAEKLFKHRELSQMKRVLRDMQEDRMITAHKIGRNGTLHYKVEGEKLYQVKWRKTDNEWLKPHIPARIGQVL